MPKLYRRIALIECGDVEAAEIVATSFAAYVVRRLSATVFVVDHERLPALLEQMRRQGITPKITEQ